MGRTHTREGAEELGEPPTFLVEDLQEEMADFQVEGAEEVELELLPVGQEVLEDTGARS